MRHHSIKWTPHRERARSLIPFMFLSSIYAIVECRMETCSHSEPLLVAMMIAFKCNLIADYVVFKKRARQERKFNQVGK